MVECCIFVIPHAFPPDTRARLDRLDYPLRAALGALPTTAVRREDDALHADPAGEGVCAERVEKTHEAVPRWDSEFGVWGVKEASVAGASCRPSRPT